MTNTGSPEVPLFNPEHVDAEHRCSRIGSGALGGKSKGLRLIHEEILSRFDPEAFPEVTVRVPYSVVIATDVFETFMERNHLWEVVLADHPDSHIAQAFQNGELPFENVDDLRGLVAVMRTPLALRPSSLLRETLDGPFPAVYTTKMIPNNEPADEARYRRFVSGLKLVWASTFFADSVVSRRAAGLPTDSERMAVVVQEVVGRRHGERFYPTVSALARSFNYYPTPGNKPEEGAVSLALGLGKTIIDDRHTWSYCPQRPTAPPPFKSMRDLLKYTQTSFWAIDMGELPPPDPIRETECLVRSGIGEAGGDGTLKFLASTYEADSDRLQPGLGGNGPRILNFAPLLGSRTIPFNQVVARLVELSREMAGAEVEIEIAAELDPANGLPMQLDFLQMRTMMAAGERFPVEESDLQAEATLVASDDCLGHGSRTDLEDIVYVRPQTFDRARTRSIAGELEAVNRGLVDEGRHGIFIGLGRWGTTDDRFGVPVRWGQISAARVIVEATLPDLPTELSQGTHFFHRLLSFDVLYMSVEHDGPYRIRWDWLDSQPAVWESRQVRHVRFETPLDVRVDGATRRGIIRPNQSVLSSYTP
ncbi:MAG: PEP/pyruvate-binding domain-containing protein [Thermoanaerobaculales bacterium]